MAAASLPTEPGPLLSVGPTTYGPIYNAMGVECHPVKCPGSSLPRKLKVQEVESETVVANQSGSIVSASVNRDDGKVWMMAKIHGLT